MRGIVWYDTQNIFSRIKESRRGEKPMSLKPQGINPVPEETARIACTAYPKGNVSMHMRDELGTLSEDESFAHLFPNNGQPAEAPLAFGAGHHPAIGRRIVRPAIRPSGPRVH